MGLCTCAVLAQYFPSEKTIVVLARVLLFRLLAPYFLITKRKIMVKKAKGLL